jgi:hypothetical protein
MNAKREVTDGIRKHLVDMSIHHHSIELRIRLEAVPVAQRLEGIMNQGNEVGRLSGARRKSNRENVRMEGYHLKRGVASPNISVRIVPILSHYSQNCVAKEPCRSEEESHYSMASMREQGTACSLVERGDHWDR